MPLTCWTTTYVSCAKNGRGGCLNAVAGDKATRLRVRKAYIVMSSESLGATAVLAWPAAEIGIMNPGSAVDIANFLL